MQTIRSQNDSSAVIVWNNNVEEASRLLRKRMSNSQLFKGIRKPRKSITLRQKRRLRRVKMVRDRNLLTGWKLRQSSEPAFLPYIPMRYLFLWEHCFSGWATSNALIAALNNAGINIDISVEECDLLDSIYLPSKYPLGGVLPDFEPDLNVCEQCMAIAEKVRNSVASHLPLWNLQFDFNEMIKELWEWLSEWWDERIVFWISMAGSLFVAFDVWSVWSRCWGLNLGTKLMFFSDIQWCSPFFNQLKSR